jgi:colanic acid biosynthesis glycosyl transferase WcaI
MVMENKPLRILIHGLNFSPELTGIGKYTSEMAEWLATKGHEVRVVTAPPYYPQWQVAAGYANCWTRTVNSLTEDGVRRLDFSPIDERRVAPKEYENPFGENRPTGKHGSLVVYRCPLWVPQKPSGLKRILHLASFALASFPVMLRQVFWKPDVVWVVEPALFCAPGALIAAKLCGAKSWLHVQDFEVDAAFEMGLLRSKQARRFALWGERFLMRRFDVVSSISPNMVRRLMQKNIDVEKTKFFINWVDIGAIFPLETPSAMRQQLDISVDCIVALYSGNMGEKQGLEIVLKAASRLNGERGIQFVLCGDGSARERLQLEYAGLSNVKWLPLQPVEKLNALLNMANVHLLPQRAGAEDLVMPSKLTGMLASGRPVIATVSEGSQIAEVLQKCGLIVEPENAERLAAEILQLAKDRAKRDELGQHAREYALQHLSKDRVLQVFEEQLKGL